MVNIDRKIELNQNDIIKWSLEIIYSGKNLFLQIMSWIFLIYTIIMIKDTGIDFFAIILIIICITYVIFIPIRFIIYNMKFAKNMLKEVNIIIYEDYIKVEFNGKEISKIQWKDITKVQETVNYYLLYINNKYLCIPKKFYSKDELVTIKKIIYTKVDKEKTEKLY